jgi:hypothetical protein
VASLSIGDSLCGDYLRLALVAGSGRLRHTGALAEATRGALLIDLARLGRLGDGGSVIQIVARPTGLGLADELIEDFASHPGREFGVELTRGQPHLHEVIAELIADGLWTVRRRELVPGAHYVDRDAQRFVELREAVAAVAHGRSDPVDARQAALVCLALVTNLVDAGPTLARPGQPLLDASGELAWITTQICDFLVTAQADDEAAATVDAETSIVQFGSI